MKKRKIGICGHFGGNKNFYDGQTVKTKIISNELISIFGEDKIELVDTYGGAKKIFIHIIKLWKILAHCKNIVILPAHNSLRIFAPFLVFLNKFYKKRLHYIVIGGWLPEFLKNKKHLTKALKKFDYIYVETNKMKYNLVEQGFDNIVIMPNCKKLNILKEYELVYNEKEPFKLCTFSRVTKQKGIEDAVKAVEYINDKYQRTVLTLDIYGSIDDTEKEWFNDLKNDFKEYVKYSGVIDYDKSVDVLKNYYALLFPTKHYTEGIPGTIIDAFSAGVPVIYSKWENCNDIIKDNITGIGYEFANEDSLIDCLENIINNPQTIKKMKTDCIKEVEKFDVSVVLGDLINGNKFI